MKKYGIQIKIPDAGYLWLLDGSADVMNENELTPLVFNSKNEAIDRAEKMQIKSYKVKIYPYKEWNF